MPSVPSFETKRLLLKCINVDDAPAYRQHFVDYEVIRHLSSLVPWPYPENGVAEFFKNVVLPPQGASRWTWAIRLKSNPAEIIGCVDLWREGRPENRGFWLGKKFWGQGYMTEAVEPVMDYAFHSLGFESLTFANAVGNIRSRRVKEKTSARFVEIKPASYVDPEYTHHEVWILSKDDWFKFRVTDTSRPKNITHYTEIQEPEAGHYPGSSESLSIGSPFAKSLGLKRLGIHHEVLPPGHRTSWPHAEQDEEEFVYVIEGHPDVWLDGTLYGLKPGDGVGFPCGTGMSHTFINNSSENVRLLVVGEAYKKTNKIFYPLNPERMEQVKDIWWHDVPKRPLGPHDGLPNKLRLSLQKSQ